MSIAAATYPNLSYHPTKTFVPLTMIANFPLIVVVPKEHPAKNVKELVEWAKKIPTRRTTLRRRRRSLRQASC